MINIKTILVDDELNSLIVLENLLKKHCTQINVIGSAQDIYSALELINNLKPELVFLDIRMPEGSAFDLLKQFRQINFDIIFVTSHHEYAINAIRLNALDYLLKPIDVNELKEAVNKALQRTNSNEVHSQVENLLNYQNAALEIKLPVHKNQEVILMSEKNIILLEGDGNYTHIITYDAQRLTIGKNLKEVELYFSSQNLIRIRRNIVINTKYIVSYTKNDPFLIELENNYQIEVSRRKRQEVLELIKKNFSR